MILGYVVVVLGLVFLIWQVVKMFRDIHKYKNKKDVNNSSDGCNSVNSVVDNCIESSEENSKNGDIK